MAVRPQHVIDAGVVERRLRPIYDWLDNGNNKKALQEAEKVLKKTPSLQAARALKSLALLRLGKSQEASTVLEALVAEKPSDDTTLQAITISYRESQQLSKVCALYEAAVRAEPGNEELHSHLFMAYVRVADYRAQLRTAMALYKFSPKNPYYFWAVMSIVLQAKSSDDNTKKGVLLSLAQRMIDVFITENKMEAEQEARLYVMILELQEKWEDILKFTEGSLYSKLLPGAMPQASIPYLRRLGRWRQLNLLCKELLWENLDRWDYYQPYLESAFHLMRNPSDTVEENTADDTAEKCHEFLCQLVESTASSRTVRGPYLARLELWKRLSEGFGDATALMGGSADLCLEYLRAFAHKPCAVPDLRPYLAIVPQQEREARAKDFLTCLGLDVNSEPETLSDVQRHVSCLGAWMLCNSRSPAAEHLGLGAALRGHYLRARRLQLAPSTPTEFCAADMYAVLAAHHFYYAAVQQQSSAPVLEALQLLELVLQHSPANFHAKLLCLTLYHLLGNAGAADTIYLRLDVKHIQLATVGWLHTARLMPCGRPSRSLQLHKDTAAFHSHHAKDSVDHLTYAYKYGTFEKLVELMGFNERIERCAWCALAARERALLSLLAGPAAPFHAPPALPAPLTDNRDLNVIINWEPSQLKDPDLQSRTFAQDTAYLRLKDALVSGVALCIELADARPSSAKKSQADELDACIEALSKEFTEFRGQEKTLDVWISMSAPFPSRIIALVNSPVPYRELYSSTLRLVGTLAVCTSDAAHLLCQEVGRRVELSRQNLQQCLDDRGLKGDPLWTARDSLEDISNYVEFIGIITFILGVCNELVTPATTKKAKKKAASQAPADQKTTELLTRLNEEVQKSISFLENILDSWQEPGVSSDLASACSQLALEEDHQSPVDMKLRNGNNDMLMDLRDILKKKLKCLKSLL